MDVAYADYEYVVLDASSLMFDIPEELWDRFEDDPALISQTFNSEYRAYLNLFPMRQLLSGNYRRLECKVRIADLFREEDYNRMGLNRDAMGLLRLLCGISTRHISAQRSCLLVTGDLSQLQYISACAVPADILYLRENCLFTAENTDELKERFEDREEEDQDMSGFAHGKNPTAYSSEGDPIPLKSVQDRKESSRIYETDDGRYAKIFHEERLTRHKIRHVEKLVEFHRQLSDAQMDLSWLLLPSELLYAEAESKNQVGYLMTKAENNEKLTNVLPVDMPIGELLWNLNCTTSYKEYLYLAWLITHQVSYLKTYNLWPSDFNLENFALCDPKQENSSAPSHYRKLYMWDTDSICWNGYMDRGTSEGVEKHWYLSNRWARDQHPPEGKYYTKEYRIDEACAISLYQCVFYILSLGMYPYGKYRQDSDQFCFDQLTLEDRDYVFFIPENLRKLFHDVFVCRHAPSVPCLLYELEIAGSADNTTLEERHQTAQEMAQSGMDFRPAKKALVLKVQKIPEVPEVSATLSRWVRNTARFQGKRCNGPVDTQGTRTDKQKKNTKE